MTRSRRTTGVPRRSDRASRTQIIIFRFGVGGYCTDRTHVFGLDEVRVVYLYWRFLLAGRGVRRGRWRRPGREGRI